MGRWHCSADETGSVYTLSDWLATIIVETSATHVRLIIIVWVVARGEEGMIVLLLNKEKVGVSHHGLVVQ